MTRRDRVYRIETQAVEMVFLQPVERIVDKEFPHGTAVFAVEIDALAPRRGVACAEKRGRIQVQIIAVGPEMIVDDIQQHHQPACVCGLHQSLQILGPAVA